MTARPYHHGDLRNALLQAAREHLRQAPPAELSLRQLAREIGVSANAPYRHFPDRDALLAAVALDGYRTLTAALRQAAPRQDGAVPLAALARAYQGFARSEPGLFRLMFTPGAHGAAEREEGQRELFAEVLASVEGEADDAEGSLRIAAGVWTAMHGSAQMALDGTLDWLDRWLRPGSAALAAAVVQGLLDQPRGRG